jgi:hypothetical protein
MSPCLCRIKYKVDTDDPTSTTLVLEPVKSIAYDITQCDRESLNFVSFDRALELVIKYGLRRLPRNVYFEVNDKARLENAIRENPGVTELTSKQVFGSWKITANEPWFTVDELEQRERGRIIDLTAANIA